MGCISQQISICAGMAEHTPDAWPEMAAGAALRARRLPGSLAGERLRAQHCAASHGPRSCQPAASIPPRASPYPHYRCDLGMSPCLLGHPHVEAFQVLGLMRCSAVRFSLVMVVIMEYGSDLGMGDTQMLDLFQVLGLMRSLTVDTTW